MRIEVWSDVVCPWCYIGKRRIERALAGFEHRDAVEVVYRSFMLDPHAPTDRTEPMLPVLARKYGVTEDRALGMMHRVTEAAAGEGLAYRLDATLRGHTGDAHRLLHLARTLGHQDALNERFMAAYFTEGRSLFDAASLTSLAVEAGLPHNEVEDVLASDRFAEDVEADIAMARELDVTGVPFMAVDQRYGLAGAHDPERVLRVLRTAWSEAVDEPEELRPPR